MGEVKIVETKWVPSGASSSWVQVVESRDMDAYARAQGGWALRYEQLSSGQFEGRFAFVTLFSARDQFL